MGDKVDMISSSPVDDDSVDLNLDKYIIPDYQGEGVPKESVDSSTEHTFRDYSSNDKVADFYRRNHRDQTVDLVREYRNKYSHLSGPKMSLWDAIKLTDTINDDSDPDLDEAQSVHLFQTAEALREIYPDRDWLHLTGLIHDLGKVLICVYHEPDHLVVGDTFPVGSRFSDKIVHSELFYGLYPEYTNDRSTGNPDMVDCRYNTKFGIYEPNVGFDNVLMSWGHDEYMYRVCVENNCTLPEEALYIVRYHSFYSQHQHSAYDHLASEKDKKMMEHVRMFQKCDLYSKEKDEKNLVHDGDLREYYSKCMNKYFPDILQW